MALEQGVVGIGWTELPDLSLIKSRDELESLYRSYQPDAKPAIASNNVGQIWSFLSRIQPGDLVVLPIPARSAVAIGQVTGGYQYRLDLSGDLRHARQVQWLKPNVPRAAFEQDLLYSFGSLLTVCQIRRNDAEERLRSMLATGSDPATHDLFNRGEDELLQTAESALDLDQTAREQIQDHLTKHFREHKLAMLVSVILEAQGYETELSPPGPDGGVDIIAGHGPLGFDPPRLVVQVKSTAQPLDVRPLRELHGVMPSFGAEQGLLVSWGGFTPIALKEARQRYFQIRLWTAEHVVDSLLNYYDKLPASIRAEIPLKHVWVLVPEG
jgi:restriction system protein